MSRKTAVQTVQIEHGDQQGTHAEIGSREFVQVSVTTISSEIISQSQTFVLVRSSGLKKRREKEERRIPVFPMIIANDESLLDAGFFFRTHNERILQPCSHS